MFYFGLFYDRNMDDRTEARVQAAEAAVAELRAEVAALRAELAGARGRVDVTMRGQTRCRGCGCRKILFAAHVLDRGDGDFRKKLAIAQPSWWRSAIAGQFEVYVCTACGLVEWYAKDLGGLEIDGESYRIIDGDAGTAGQGPYR